MERRRHIAKGLAPSELKPPDRIVRWRFKKTRAIQHHC